MQYPARFGGCIALLLLLLSCVEPIRPEFNYRDGFIFVDGEISNLAGRSRLSLQQAELRLGTYRLLPYRAATVQTIAEDGTAVDWQPVDDTDLYVPPEDFTGQAGQSYFLRIMTTDGEVIESDPELLATAVPIDTFQIVFDQESYFSDQLHRFVPAFGFAVDFRDPAGERNYYRFRHRTWEMLDVCLRCSPGRADPVSGECLPTPFPLGAPYLDYPCRQDCWEVTAGEDVNLFSDEFINGNPVRAYHAGRVDFDYYGGLLVAVEQQVITQRAFEYSEVIQRSTTGSGGLNAALPATLDGNVNLVSGNTSAVRRVHELGFNLVVQSNRPYTVPNGFLELNGLPVPLFLERNNARLPVYHRLDFSWTVHNFKREKRRWTGDWNFTIFNLYGRDNAYNIYFAPKGNGTPLAIFSRSPLGSYKLSIFAAPVFSLGYKFKFE